MALVALAAVLCLPAVTSAKPVPRGAHYVAMGSSFGAGPSVGQPAPGAPARCQRSSDNYARQLARRKGLELTDVTCGGATTAHILGPWNELPPQIDALRPDTRLVTLTIGGNDLGYIGGLIAGSCTSAPQGGTPASPMCAMIAAGRRSGALLPTPTEEGWRKVEAGMSAIVAEIRRRSPRARIVFVDYQTVLPERGNCAQVPLSAEALETGRATAARLAALTASVARANGAEVLRASALSRRHDACSRDPWMYGFLPPAPGAPFTPYHPNLAGMTALADALHRHLSR